MDFNGTVMLDLFSVDSEIVVVDKNKSRSKHIIFYIKF